ncbi:hypothetical protein PCANC_00698 [Puccinia coronata f. sp. avenae]|uniref:Uncharacterized protein n=1 Tax=Puccinia coronata f. sp. avenae TaxID=200324 RepID=A0A2N5W6Z3_9BASI|nr:hypothetical protein PCANC_25552 [Puccinia coronata f. sp. avenae]PLW58014.1 hypothetical protein PCANC_00698 [Puccinia coronata f. sp. avenae]
MDCSGVLDDYLDTSRKRNDTAVNQKVITDRRLWLQPWGSAFLLTTSKALDATGFSVSPRTDPCDEPGTDGGGFLSSNSQLDDNANDDKDQGDDEDQEDDEDDDNNNEEDDDNNNEEDDDKEEEEEEEDNEQEDNVVVEEEEASQMRGIS